MKFCHAVTSAAARSGNNNSQIVGSGSGTGELITLPKHKTTMQIKANIFILFRLEGTFVDTYNNAFKCLPNSFKVSNLGLPSFHLIISLSFNPYRRRWNVNDD